MSTMEVFICPGVMGDNFSLWIPIRRQEGSQVSERVKYWELSVLFPPGEEDPKHIESWSQNKLIGVLQNPDLRLLLSPLCNIDRETAIRDKMHTGYILLDEVFPVGMLSQIFEVRVPAGYERFDPRKHLNEGSWFLKPICRFFDSRRFSDWRASQLELSVPWT